MTKLLIIFALIVCSLPFNSMGMISIEWLDYQFEISFTFLIIITLITFIILYIAFSLINILCAIPKCYKENIKLREEKRQIAAIRTGIFSILENNNHNLESSLKTIDIENIQNIEFKKIFLGLNLNFFKENEDVFKAKDYAFKLLNNDPKNIFALKSLLIINYKNQDFLEAAKYAENYNKINEEDFEVLSIYNDICLKLKNFKMSYKLIDKLLKYNFIDKEKAAELSAATYLKEANFELENQNNLNSALKLLNKAWELKPSNEILSLIVSLKSKDNFEDKIKIIEELIKKAPDAGEGYNALAELYLNESKFEEGIQKLNKLIKKDLNNVELIKNMTLLYAKSNGSYYDIARWLNKL